jgi:tryptophanyl-tRNA synthetase
VTDSEGNSITFEPERRKGLSNLLELYSAFTNREIKDIVEEYQKNNYNIQKFKDNLGSIIVECLTKIQINM